MTDNLPRWSAVSVDPADRRPVVAAFDVDGTVTTRDCVVPFLRRVGGTVPMAARFGLSALRDVPALARRDRDRLKALAAKVVFTGRLISDVDRAGDEFAGMVAGAWIRPDTLARMHWHHDAGDDVVFVSASFGTYLRPLGHRLGVVTDVVSTELAVDDDGRCTGGLVGANCRGPEKVRRLHAWLEEHRGGREAVELWAYGDSPGDRELLADADRAMWVGTTLPEMPRRAL